MPIQRLPPWWASICFRTVSQKRFISSSGVYVQTASGGSSPLRIAWRSHSRNCWVWSSSGSPSATRGRSSP